MAIEIKQLIIRAVVEEPRPQPAATTPRPAPPGSAQPPQPVQRLDRQEVIAACARQVLRELRRGRER